MTPSRLLATEWAQSGRSWTFTLRDGVTFHDGTKLTAEAVVNSLTKAAAASPKPRILDGVELTAKADGDKVTVTTATEDPLVPQRLSSPSCRSWRPRPTRARPSTPSARAPAPSS